MSGMFITQCTHTHADDVMYLTRHVLASFCACSMCFPQTRMHTQNNPQITEMYFLCTCLTHFFATVFV